MELGEFLEFKEFLECQRTHSDRVKEAWSRHYQRYGDDYPGTYIYDVIEAQEDAKKDDDLPF